MAHKATLRVLLCGTVGIGLRRYRKRIESPVCACARLTQTNDGRQLRSVAHARAIELTRP